MSAFDQYKVKRKETLNQQVYKIIKSMIIDGELKPGDKLNETDVAESLEVSATPVRETFRNLETEGLVEIIPYRGVFVRKYDLNEIKEAYECRIALEQLAIELSLDNLELDDLQNLLNRCEEADVEDEESILELSNDIHNLILEKSNNKILLNLYYQISHILLRDRNISSHNLKRKKEIIKEHKNIILSLINKDKITAKENMEIHINNGFEYIRNHIDKNKKGNN